MKVVVQHREVHGLGLYASVGTPGRDIFFTPDFGISNTRLYLDDVFRSVFLPDHESSTAVTADKGYMKDDLRLGGLKFGGYKFKVQFEADANDMRHQVDSEGRLALSPLSQIGKLRTIHACMDKVTQSDGTEKRELTLDFIANVPATPEGVIDVILPTSGNGLYGWFVRSKVLLNGEDISGGFIDIAFDPTSNGIQLSQPAMENLVQAFHKVTPHFTIDNNGYLLVPCNELGVYTYPMMFPVELADGRKFFIEMPGRGFQPTTSVSGILLCPSEISIALEHLMNQSTEMIWKIDPFLLPDVGEVFFKGNSKNAVPTIVLRLNDEQRIPDKFERVAPPQMALMYDVHEYHVLSKTDARLVFRPAGPGVPHRYTPVTRVATDMDDGIGITFEKKAGVSSSCPFSPSSVTIGGPFEFEEYPQLHFDRETGSVFIPLKIAKGMLRKSSMPRYSLSIERINCIFIVLFRRVTLSSHNTLAADLIDEDLKRISENMASIGHTKSSK